MTQYVLNSGGIDNHPGKLPAFLEETFRGYQEVRILLCHFAKQPERWNTEPLGYEKAMVNFISNSSHRIASYENFEESCEWATHIHFSGGDAWLCGDVMKRFTVEQLFKDKVILGNSGGIAWLMKHFWSNDRQGCFDGLGIIEAKFMPHYLSNYTSYEGQKTDWNYALNKLKQYGDTSLPVYALEEGDFIVIEQ